MKSFNFCCLLIVLFICNVGVLADSPITSTPFAYIYEKEKIIIAATKAKGIITPELMEYLSKNSNPIELKMAVVNQLGWQNKIKDNAIVYFRFLVFKYHYKSEAEFIENGTGDELLAMAYLKAMDDHQEVTPAIKFANSALEKNPKSLTYNLITGLIKAQKSMDGDWCEVFKISDSIRQNSELTIDMKTEATKIIFNYTDSYQEFCK